ncbi:histidine phosphatase family protein [Moraxella sp. Tifton1]|uniref:SixA phosphatase family protein n=1 Tax=Moraxella oculi TaxID=2940516 RepID=UPI00201111C4|nr:histidine phosphatase family protein [Moraxella sp. Tifton1]MCL1622859.1 histidine phosphatase family protein [Moraxella sp. Tifton1]
MMKLILVRHGQAGPYCEDDAGRNLTHFGKIQAKQTADFLAELTKLDSVDVIITSPYHRAKQTANIIFEKLNDVGQSPKLMVLNGITPDDDPRVGMREIDNAISPEFNEQTESLTVIVVCHMPIVARMASMIDGLPPAFFELAECRVFELPFISDGLAKQITHFIPNQP